MINQSERLIGLQALRFATAFLVLVYHASLFAWQSPANPRDQWQRIDEYWLTLNAGNIGVLIFFAISGYVICLSRRTDVRTFVLLRLSKVYPGYLFAFALGSLIMFISGVASPSQVFFDWSMTLLPIGSTHGSWSGVPYWTLNFEVYFYLVAAVMMLFPPRAFGWLMVAWALALLLIYPLFPNPPDGLFGQMVWGSPYGLFFIGGALLALAKNGEHGPLGVFLAFVGGVTLLGQRHEFLWQLLLLVTCVGLTYSATNCPNPGSITSKVLDSLGNWSYGIYLLHLPIIRAVAELTPNLNEGARFLLATSLGLFGGIIFGAAEDLYFRSKIRPWAKGFFGRKRDQYAELPLSITPGSIRD